MKKDFTLERHEVGVQECGETAIEGTITTVDQARVSKPANTVVAFPENATSARNADFGPFYGQGYDNITAACQRTIERLVAEPMESLSARARLRVTGKMAFVTLRPSCRYSTPLVVSALPWPISTPTASNNSSST